MTFNYKDGEDYVFFVEKINILLGRDPHSQSTLKEDSPNGNGQSQ